MIELFSEDPFFPFTDYATDLRHFSGAQRYWLAFLRDIEGFNEANWHPVLRPVDVEDDQMSGLMAWLRNSSWTKEIDLHTQSLPGAVAVYVKDNGPMARDAIVEAKSTFGWDPEERFIRGVTEAEATADVRPDYKPFQTWVERASAFQPDPKHSEGGQLVDIERLILTSEISRESEPMARHALELFVQDGPAIDRVNGVFVSPED